jgi:redox-sensitive bicupin YhaK (pirin superfamily)
MFANDSIKTRQLGVHNSNRKLLSIHKGIAISDGAGVKLTRIIGSKSLSMLDPFLLLDCFESDNPDDYIAGFPTHPHRGFETVTYLLNGQMRHQDSKGNEGVIESGGVQWMTAGKGIQHSEMPEQTHGLLKGFQLWVNLPSSVKMMEPSYQEFSAAQVPLEKSDIGYQVRVIAGSTDLGTLGPVINPFSDPVYMDVNLLAQYSFKQQLVSDHAAFIYVISGQIDIGGEQISANQLGVLNEGERVIVKGLTDSQFLLIAAKQMKEPVARYGPFVMNTQQEIEQAFIDYRQGKFA